MTDRELAGCALLPCPFCGEAPDLEREVIHFPGRHPKRFAVRCLTEGCPASNIAQDGEMGGFNYSWNEADAIAAWNRRTPSSEGDGERLDLLRRIATLEADVNLLRYGIALDKEIDAEEAAWTDNLRKQHGP